MFYVSANRAAQYMVCPAERNFFSGLGTSVLGERDCQLLSAVWILFLADSRAEGRANYSSERAEDGPGESAQHRAGKRLPLLRLTALGVA